MLNDVFSDFYHAAVVGTLQEVQAAVQKLIKICPQDSPKRPLFVETLIQAGDTLTEQHNNLLQKSSKDDYISHYDRKKHERILKNAQYCLSSAGKLSTRGSDQKIRAEQLQRRAKEISTIYTSAYLK